jgi:hypothetical protein
MIGNGMLIQPEPPVENFIENVDREIKRVNGITYCFMTPDMFLTH